MAGRLAEPGVRAEDIDNVLLQSYRPYHAPKPTLVQTPGSATNLEAYWLSKRVLRDARSLLQARMYNVSWTDRLASVRALPSASSNITCLLRAWQAAVKYQRTARELNRKIRQSKRMQAEGIIAQAQAADRKGLTYVYKVMHRSTLKDPKRSIHLKDPKQGLLSPRQALQTITDYFSKLYQSQTRTPSQSFQLTEPLHISLSEIEDAIRSISQRKTLPKGQAPAVLWKHCRSAVAPVLHRDFAARFQPGLIQLPTSWNRAFIALLPKPRKPPCTPENLRPISILPAVSKLLARICAQRVRPPLEQELRNQPQYAYLVGRQTLDAIDRVFSHCHRTRQAVSNLRPSPSAAPHRSRVPLRGGPVITGPQ